MQRKSTTIQKDTPSPSPKPKKVNFFLRQNANREQKQKEEKMAKEKVLHETIIKDKRLMSKEDMIHLLEDSITRAFNPKDNIIKSNCLQTKSFLEKQG